jgi:hypothetical protein
VYIGKVTYIKTARVTSREKFEDYKKYILLLLMKRKELVGWEDIYGKLFFDF